jgi:hypothetical protein
MAHADNSIITGKFKGSLGKQLVFREWDGKTVVAKAPKKRSGDPTAEQAQKQEKFLLASRYAKSIVKSNDQSLAEAYATALRPRQNVYSRALEDFMSSPIVHFINTKKYRGEAGDKIVVRAHDDFRLTDVKIEMYDSDGKLLETGYAEQNTNGLDWTYTATQNNKLNAGGKIKAIATDIPGNEGMLEVSV